MDLTFRRPCADMEGACPGDDLRRKSYDRRFGHEHDRRGIRAGTSRNWLLDYARFGIPITILTTVAGTFGLLVLH